MISQVLHEILCCPQTHQRLELAQLALITQLNQQIAAGGGKNWANGLVKAPVETGLVREDHQLLYPVSQGIPVLLLDEAIPLSR